MSTSITILLLLVLTTLTTGTPTPAPTNAPTPAPTTAPVPLINSFISVDFPTTVAAAINQQGVRQGLANSVGVPVTSVVLVSLGALQGGGTRVLSQIITPRPTQTILQQVQRGCPSQLVSLGALCSTVATGIAPSPSATADDDESQTAGIIVGAVVGGLCLLGLLAAAAFFILRKSKAPASEFDIVPTRYSDAPAPGYAYPPTYPGNYVGQAPLYA